MAACLAGYNESLYYSERNGTLRSCTGRLVFDLQNHITDPL